jgi:hypothetical protein
VNALFQGILQSQVSVRWALGSSMTRLLNWSSQSCHMLARHPQSCSTTLLLAAHHAGALHVVWRHL